MGKVYFNRKLVKDYRSFLEGIVYANKIAKKIENECGYNTVITQVLDREIREMSSGAKTD